MRRRRVKFIMQILARTFSVTRAQVSTVAQCNVCMRVNCGLKMQSVTTSMQPKTRARLAAVVPRDMLTQWLESVIRTLKLMVST